MMLIKNHIKYKLQTNQFSLINYSLLSVIFLLIKFPIIINGQLSSLSNNTSIENRLNIEDNYNHNNNNSKNELININELASINYIIGVSKVAIESNENPLSSSSSPSPAFTKCQHELSVFLNATENHEVWALKLIDSYGNMPKGFNWGNYFWFTSKELCDDLNHPYNISLSSRYKRNKHPNIMNTKSPFDMQFRMMYFNFTTPYFVDIKLQLEHFIYIGLCIPKSCNTHEIVKYTKRYFETKLFKTQQLYDINMKFTETKVPEFRWSFLLNPGLMIFCMALITILTFIALAEVIVRLRNHHPDFKKINNNLDDSYSNVEKFLLCWSIRDNIKTALSMENSKKIFPCIAGLRTIICLWVTLFHVYYYSLYTINNIPLVFSKLENFILQPVLQSCFYVDVFFVISAFLHVFHFLSNTNRIEIIKQNNFVGNMKLFLKLVLHRYVRLMPVFFIIMVISEAIFEFLDMYSPFLMNKYNGLYCRDTWWYNVFFINNFLDLKYICASWSWYLGCEMQFFIIFLIILFIYAKNEYYAKIVFIISTTFFTLISFYTNYHHGITFELDVVYSTLEQLYVKPWTRIVPYFGGALMGWFYFNSVSSSPSSSSSPSLSMQQQQQQQQKSVKFSKCFLTFYWLLVAITYLATCEMSYWRKAPIWIVSIIMSFGKLYFGILWGSVIYMCQHGYGGIFAKIMGSKLFLHLNKFCYSVYMMAPILITGIYGLRTESTQFSEVGSATDLFTIISISFTLTIAMYTLLELPCNRISNKFILKRS